ncbi:GntP family permease [Weissella muntiaci]|uniref:GntP family permease n=1 Tax=Weissella muntiaci TaxID=2508881 RepID=A0A6C2C9F5_9LACO|nr:GntP family permease [Weissella muntiaci]TYC50670.1 GntP family permease [Weissella muntiaci]
MGLLGTIGILIGICTIILLVVKEVHITIAALIASLLVVLLNNMDVIKTLLGSEPVANPAKVGTFLYNPHAFMPALGDYIISYFAIFLFGAILAKFMEASGATVSIANFILKKFGSDSPYRVLVAVFVITTLLTYGGISLFVAMFAIIPLARALFKKLDIAWTLVTIPLWLGLATITMVMLPGTPAIQNVIPMTTLGTSLTADALPSLVAAVATTIFGLFYMRYALNKSLKKGENFATYADINDVDETNRELPSFGASISPLLLLIIIAISGSVLGNELVKKNVIYVALILAILLSVILFRKFISQPKTTLTLGTTSAFAPIIATASAVAFGAVVVGAPGFEVIQKAIFHMPGGSLISLTALTSVITAITGSSSGALGIVMPNFAQHYLAAGIQPQIIHRVAAVASGFATLVPQSGAFITFLALSKLKQKNSYKYAVTTVAVGNLIGLIIIILFASL